MKKFFNTDYGKFLAITISVLVILTLYFRLIGPIPFSVNQITTEKKTTFDVQAEGKVTAVPDTAEINLGIQSNKPTVEAAQKEANEKINNITSELKKLGIEEKYIKTSNYSVYPDYNYQAGQKITGYNVNITLTIKVKDLQKINNVIDIATAQGANQIGNLSFVIDDDKLESLKMEARKQAIEKAKIKAKEIANAGGIKLGRLVDVTESVSSYNPTPLRTPATALAGGGVEDKQTQIQAGESEITINITISYETL
ncbi:MAG: SIMPL domain-containing protein [Candidatus Shapirobacteria bacterium]|nr:SIMPL domain-containing protein [Candidatus Shapirobacteria bacterium]